MSSRSPKLKFLSVAMRAVRGDLGLIIDIDLAVEEIGASSRLAIRRHSMTDSALVVELTTIEWKEGDEIREGFRSIHELFDGCAAFQFVVLMYEGRVTRVVTINDPISRR